MPAAFTWPPAVVAEAPSGSSYGFFYSDNNHTAYHILPYDSAAGLYRCCRQDYFSGQSRLFYQSNVSPVAGGTGGGFATGNNGATYTTSNGVGIVGGYAYAGEVVTHRVGTDFGGAVFSWGSVQASATGTYRGLVYLIDSIGTHYTWATSFDIERDTPFAAVMGTSSDIYCFYGKQVATGSSMGSPIYTNFIYWTKVNAGTYTAEANLLLPQATINQYGRYLLDAGEGYYYLLYDHGGFLGIVGVDLSGGGTPVVTGLLGGSGVSGWNATMPRPITQRYINLSGNRVIGFQTATEFITITFTSGTKATPTIVKTTRACSFQQVAIEYDPTGNGGQGAAYVAGYSASGAYPVAITGGYVPFGSPGTAFSSPVTIASIYSPLTPNVLREFAFGCAQNADVANNVFAGGVSVTFGDAGSVGLVFTCWHTPVLFELGVESGTDYSSVAAGREVIMGRSVEATSTYTGVTAGIALGGAHADDFQWLIGESNEYSYGVSTGTGYSSVSLDFEIISVMEVEPLTQHWTNAGHDFMDDFMVYVNQDRAAVGLPPYKTYGADGLFLERRDIATYQATQMSWFEVFAHESPLYPADRRTIPLRGDYMPATGIAENIIFDPWYDLSTQTDFGYITPYELWLAWHNSPVHYANIIRNWGTEYNNTAYSILGLAEGDYPSNFPAYSIYKALYAVNVFVVLETLMFETSLQQNWGNEGALISLLEQQYAIDTWVHVAARHEAPYSVRLSTQYEASWGCRVAAQHEVPITFSAAMQIEFPYTGTEPITPVQHEAGYRISDTEPVRAQNEAEWSVRVAATLETPYSLRTPVASSLESGYRIRDTQPVLAQHEAGFVMKVARQHEHAYAMLTTLKTQHESGYRIFNTEPVAAQHESGFALRVARQNEAGWSLQPRVRVQMEHAYGDRNPVKTQQQIDYSLLAANPVRVGMLHYYAMQDYVSTLVANSKVRVVFADGTDLLVDDAVISSAAGDTGYSFECSLTDLAVFARVSEDDPIVVDFCGELYDFIINGKSLGRDGPTGVSFRITANNAVERTGAPYAQEIDFTQSADALASQLIDSLVEIDFNYELPDWTIPAGRLQAAGATPLEAVRQIAEAPGGVVDGDVDGTMWLRLPYPHPMNALDTATVDQHYSDEYDNLSVSSQTQYRGGENRFRVREGDASFSDQLEWVADEVQPNPNYETGIVKAYLSPYRNTAQIGHLGNAIGVTQLGERVETLEELVEFNEGAGNTRRPIHQLLSVEWYTADMGTPVFAFYSTLLNVNPTVNKGYGLAKVRYNAKHLTARATGVPANVESGKVGPASSYAYFILEETNG